MKDLVDQALFIEALDLQPGPALRMTVEFAFNLYETHPIPTRVGMDPPPDDRNDPFARDAAVVGLTAASAPDEHAFLARFLHRPFPSA